MRYDHSRIITNISDDLLHIKHKRNAKKPLLLGGIVLIASFVCVLTWAQLTQAICSVDTNVCIDTVSNTVGPERGGTWTGNTATPNSNGSTNSSTIYNSNGRVTIKGSGFLGTLCGYREGSNTYCEVTHLSDSSTSYLNTGISNANFAGLEITFAHDANNSWSMIGGRVGPTNQNNMYYVLGSGSAYRSQFDTGLVG